MKQVTDATWNDEVLMAEEPVVVEFWAPWCGPCRKVAPLLETLAEKNPAIKFVQVNTDENADVSMSYGVLSIPYMVVLDKGEVVGELTGAWPMTKIVDMIDTALA